jgi:hypothetical protein
VRTNATEPRERAAEAELGVGVPASDGVRGSGGTHSAGLEVELRVRRFILALLTFGLLALGLELIAIGHYEDAWQWVPIGLIALTLVVIAWHVVAGRASGLVALQILLVLVIAAGGLGIFLHSEANMSFQREMNPELGGWELVRSVLHAIAPPSLAPGVMAQLGVLGLIYIYRHPARSTRPAD